MFESLLEYIYDKANQNNQSTLISLAQVLVHLAANKPIYMKTHLDGSNSSMWTKLLQASGSNTVFELYKIVIRPDGKSGRVRRSKVAIHRFIGSKLYAAFYLQNKGTGHIEFYRTPPPYVQKHFQEGYKNKFQL